MRKIPYFAAMLSLTVTTLASPAANHMGLADGKFGSALARGVSGESSPNAVYGRTPLTVECTVKLGGRQDYNILAAYGPKQSSSHWEIYASPGNGFLSAYLPGCTPPTIVSTADIGDGQWHAIAMTREARRVRLFVDGREVANQGVSSPSALDSAANPLFIGNVSDFSFQCDQQIDEVRISDVIRDVSVPAGKPFEADEHTIGLWHFDSVTAQKLAEDSSRMRNAMAIRLSPEFLAEQDWAKVAPSATALVANEFISKRRDPSFFGSGRVQTHSDRDVSFAAAPQGAPERTFLAGDPIDLSFQGLNPRAVYAIELIFLSNTRDRAFAVTAGAQLMEERIPIPAGKVFRPRYLIPEDAYADGKLTLEIGKLTGAAVAISGFQLFSDDPKPLRAVAPAGPDVPRYTPRPSLVAGTDTLAVDLDGTWNFNPEPAPGFWRKIPEAEDWKPIRVPGEWAMQGFRVPPWAAAGYMRSFVVPKNWAGLRTKLRCDAAFSHSTVFINGRKAGEYVGGFTPFEMDVTDLVQPGRTNVIALALRSASTADLIDSAMSYAGRDLGGILRKIRVFAVPHENVADIYVTTKFDEQFRDATVEAAVQVANDGTAVTPSRRLSFELLDGKGRLVRVSPAWVMVPALAAGQNETVKVSFKVTAPKPWDVEHPNLYTLQCALDSGRGVSERVSRRFGFRQVEVRGNQLVINNHPVKIRGTARHEVDPAEGRSMLEGSWRRDVELLRMANINNVRTTHYPPAEEFIEACDELGMFVEEEAPVCWVNNNGLQPYATLLINAQSATILRDRSHPSVIMWSLGNECTWGSSSNLAADALFAEKLDPTRTLISEGGSGEPMLPVPADVSRLLLTRSVGAATNTLILPIPAPHYPSLQAPAVFDSSPVPILIGEYGHLTDYNRTELYTDPGLRDVWGEGFSKMWESMFRSRATVGGNMWAALDEVFFEPNGYTDGCGPWGILDGWRRPKPEYFYVQKIYSPIRITAEALPLKPANNQYRFTVENRMDFSNLSELRFCWVLGSRSGWLTSSAGPHGKGTLAIPSGSADAGRRAKLRIEVQSPRGFTIDSYDFEIGPAPVAESARLAGPVTLEQDADTITIRGTQFAWAIDTHTGLIKSAKYKSKAVITSGPHLMLLPWQPGGAFTILTGPEPVYAPVNRACTGWRASKVTARQSAQDVVVNVSGHYDQAEYSYAATFDATGRLSLAYSFNPTSSIRIWELGVAFELPREFETLSWVRKSAWTGYPTDHIGRPEGVARASSSQPMVGPFGPRTAPTWGWSQDNAPIGCNDFRSSKWHILKASLTGASGARVQVTSDGRQNARCWIDGEHARLFIIDFANQGSAGFVTERVYPDRNLEPGTDVKGYVRLELGETAGR